MFYYAMLLKSLSITFTPPTVNIPDAKVGKPSTPKDDGCDLPVQPDAHPSSVEHYGLENKALIVSWGMKANPASLALGGHVANV
jgi:hypothetical protein